MKTRTVSFLLLCGVLLCSGCGGGGPGGLVKGKGFVTLDSDPVSGASVVFLPTTENALIASAQTDENGRFTLSTNDFEGVRPGHYKVIVTKTELPAGAEAEPEAKAGDTFPSQKKMQAVGMARNVLPEVYADVKTTPLSDVEVPSGGSDKLELSLTKSGK